MKTKSIVIFLLFSTLLIVSSSTQIVNAKPSERESINVKHLTAILEMTVDGQQQIFRISIVKGQGLDIPTVLPPWWSGISTSGCYLIMYQIYPAPPPEATHYVLELSPENFKWSLGGCTLSAYLPEEDVCLSLEMKTTPPVDKVKVDNTIETTETDYPNYLLHYVYTIIGKTGTITGHFGDAELTAATNHPVSGNSFAEPMLRHRVGYREWSPL